MKQWFPLTDYDFYAYITAGVILITAIDYAFGASVLVGRTEWTFAQGVFWAMMSYLVGHIAAGLSSVVMESLLLRRVLTNPVVVILGLEPMRWFDKPISYMFAKEFGPFPSVIASAIVAKLRTKIGVQPDEAVDPEALFHTAFAVARYDKDCEVRLNQFMNVYGLCRNVAFVALVSAILFWVRAFQTTQQHYVVLAWGAFFLALGMFGRFVKFYSAYTREVFRAFERVAQ